MVGDKFAEGWGNFQSLQVPHGSFRSVSPLVCPGWRRGRPRQMSTIRVVTRMWQQEVKDDEVTQQRIGPGRLACSSLVPLHRLDVFLYRDWENPFRHLGAGLAVGSNSLGLPL